MINAEPMEMNDDLLISSLLGEATIEQDKQIEEWRKEDPANENHFNQFKVIWETSDQLKYNGKIDAAISLQRLKQKIAIQKAVNLEKTEGRADDVTTAQNKITRLGTVGYLFRIAAALVLMAGAGWLYTNHVAVKELEFLTQKTAQVDTLSDGSVITLNKHSLLRYPDKFKGAERQVWLTRGEAFFNITPDKKKPFLIHTGSTTIRVVGTSFNVKNKGEDIEVIVETGMVQVSRNGEMVSLRPGEKVVVQRNKTNLIKEGNTDQLYAYYRSKEFVADNTPLRRVVEILNEAYESNIVIGRKELEDVPLNTTFKNESLDQVLKIISRTFKIKVDKKPNKIVLY